MNLPLENKTIISTRPEVLAKELEYNVSKLGGTLIHFPMIKTEAAELSPLDIEIIKGIDQFGWITFSSAAGAGYFFTICKQLNVSKQVLRSLKYTAIGPATANKIQDFGYSVTYTDKESNGKTYGSNLNKLIPKHSKVLLIKGKLANSNLSSAFTNEQQVQRISIYNTLCPDSWNNAILKLIVNNKYDLIFFTSPSGFNNFIQLFADKIEFNNLKIAAIGPTTARSIKSKKIQPELMCKGPSVDQVIDSFTNYFKTNKPLI